MDVSPCTDLTAGEHGQGDSQFTVVADERTNSIVVTATPSVQARLAELIPELDAPQRQVNVQVRIQEINRRVASNLGINLGAASGNFAANLLDSGLRFVFDPQSAVSGLNIGAVLDTLESQGLSRRVDDTTLTVLNNGTGRMQSGGRIEITFPSSDGEIATRTIEFGVIIEVSPRVADDGRVTLDVSAEVSDVLVPINEGGIPERIDFSERNVTSTVTLRPGQTVLLGGLLQNSFSQTERRVPILGQIPLIGALFGSTEVEEENSELMLVVNAQVID
ncbi:MAG: secretin N-terminal domain-containing protein [Trueperaceae bacterium]|nr:secretin N-terminal domain-containing protein [Trueperaceae bacterium]